MADVKPEITRSTSSPTPTRGLRPFPMMRAFLDSQASGGFAFMAASALAPVVANSPLAPAYFDALHACAASASL